VAEGVLGEIAAAKRDELKRRYNGVSLDALRAAASSTDRSLAAALAQEGARFVLEIKRASPSAGTIRKGADPAALARGYEGVADALSVLCDSAYFGGSLADLTTARSEFEGPILAKDFFIDLRQVAEARIAGADAILVMLSLLDDEAARAMIDEAARFGMDALVEVHDEAEMHRAIAVGAALIGINNRDLRDLSIDLATTERLAKIAPDCVLVSESGVNSRGDIDRLAPLVDAFLIGSSLMRSEDPAQAARELLFGRTKLCGLNCGADLRAARPAAFAGFVFVPGSPRHVTADDAAPLAGSARRSGILPVGVFRDAPSSVVAKVANDLELHAVQLHGREDADYITSLRPHLPKSCEVWTAVSVGRDPLTERGGDRLLFDNADGATGRMFDWLRIAGHPKLGQALLAGGIGAHNARAAQRLKPYAIDVGSSVDAEPGRKSREKIGALFDALRSPARSRLRACA
jgi:indole-3-glycerol phosphate synthase/phosphoribosylanthranilate isomerase